ncbi:hypothetical protein DVH24_025240 [Malus domestica]|uniref:Uncharacterized protein n=1 Tax=Malus domestica TaxID=3750 RepID=A0A498HLE7_MALDO|nr:hypothetical protein DVH24_025240 [Malus domestica]
MSTTGPIIEDAKSLLHLVTEAIASHVRRQANSIAHRLAHFALHGGCGLCDLLAQCIALRISLKSPNLGIGSWGPKIWH